MSDSTIESTSRMFGTFVQYAEQMITHCARLSGWQLQKRDFAIAGGEVSLQFLHHHTRATVRARICQPLRPRQRKTGTTIWVEFHQPAVGMAKLCARFVESQRIAEKDKVQRKCQASVAVTGAEGSAI